MARVDNLTNFLTDVASAIKTKKGDNTDILASNFDTEIANLPSGGGDPTEEKKVFLYTPYGDLAYSYSVNEFNELSEMPSGVEIEGLTFQEWNWTLAEIKSYLATTGGLAVYAGGTYTTSDGKLKFHFNLAKPETITFTTFAIEGTPTIDWGDGTTETISTSGALTHEYQTTGDMVISIDGNVTLAQNFFNSQQLRITEAHLTNMKIRPSLFTNSIVNKLTLSNTVAPYGNASSNMSGFLQNAQGIQCVVLPRGLDITSASNYVIGGAPMLEKFILAGNTSATPYQFINNVEHLECLTIPLTATVSNEPVSNVPYAKIKELGVVSSSTSAYQVFKGLNYLKKAYLSAPQATSMSYTFNGCHALEEVHFGDVSSVTSWSYTFNGCRSLKSITIPANVTSFGDETFSQCRLLKELTLPSGTTSLGGACFSTCQSLTYLKIPKGVSTINTNLFLNSGLQVIDFSDHESVPTLSNVNAFSGLINANTYEIRVPSALYNDWVAATNWSDSTIVSHIVAV